MAPVSAAAVQSDTLRIFICYSRRDLKAADAIVEALEGIGFEVFIDRRNLPYGEEWQEELADAIRSSDTVVWLVSPESIGSRWCRWELGEVQRSRKRLLPVQLHVVAPDQLPEGLGRLQLLPTIGSWSEQRHLPELVAALRTDYAWVKEARRLGDRARQWRSARSDRSLLLRGAALAAAEDWRLRQPSGLPSPPSDVLDLVLASRQATTRRHRGWVGGLATLLALSVGGGLWAWSQKIEADVRRQEAAEQRAAAEKQTAIAERNFGISIDATEQLAIGIARDLRQATGMRMDRVRGILDRAEAFYARLSTEGGMSRRLLRSEIWLLQELARTYRRLGDAKAALQRIERSVTLARRLHTAGFAARDSDNLLAETLLEQADVIAVVGDDARVLASFDEALGLLRPHAVDEAGRRRLMDALHNLGLSVAGLDAERSRAALRERFLLAQQSLIEAPADWDVARRLALAGHDLAWRFWGDRDLAAARKLFGELKPLWRRIIAERPSDQASVHGLLRTLQRLADVESQSHNTAAALEADEEGLQLARKLAEARPDDHQALIDLIFALSRLAQRKHDAGQVDGIDELIAQAHRLARTAAGDTSDAYAAEQLGQTLVWTAALLDKRGDRPAALRALRDSITAARHQVGLSPGVHRAEFDLAIRLVILAEKAEAMEAIAALREAIGILEAQKAAEKLDPSQFRYLDDYKGRLAKLEGGTAVEPPRAPATAPNTNL